MSFAWPDDAAGPQAADYAQIVLDAVKNGDAEYRWAALDVTWKTHRATFKVLERPIRIDGFYPGAGARLAQQVADLLGAIFLTARLSDLRFKAAQTKIPPQTYGMMRDAQGNPLPVFPGGAPKDMTMVYVMRLYAQYLDAAAAEADWAPGRILGDCGKPWIIDNQLAATPTLAENYGFYELASPGPGHRPAMDIFEPGSLPDVSVIQGYWFPPAHGAAQTSSYAGDQADYSETLSGFVHRTCTVDGVARDIVDVAADPETAGLVSVNGLPLTVFRQPNIPVYACPVGKNVASPMGPAAASDLCPLPPEPGDFDSGGGSSGSNGKIWLGSIAGLAALGGIGWGTRRIWLPRLRRLFA